MGGNRVNISRRGVRGDGGKCVVRESWGNLGWKGIRRNAENQVEVGGAG